MDYDEEYLALARRVLMRPSLDYGELSSELSNDGWVSRSLDAAILQVILSEKGNALWLRSSPFFRQFDDGERCSTIGIFGSAFELKCYTR